MVLNIKGRQVLIDDKDYPLVSSYRWHIGSTGYAVWRGTIDGVKRTIRMHRLITGCPDDKVVDHINHDQLDNRRCNLKVCTQSENMRNKRLQGKGYWFQKQNRNWVVELNGRHIGVFQTEKEASDIVQFVRAGGIYIKPERAHCKYGHPLDDAYDYGKGKRCRKCQSIRSREYYGRNQIRWPKGTR